MSKKMASVIMAYGVVLAALSLVVRSVASELRKITFITDIGGGGLCVLWPIVALARIDVTGGKVFIEGEYWNAVSEVAVEKDQPGEGLTLKLKPKTN